MYVICRFAWWPYGKVEKNVYERSKYSKGMSGEPLPFKILTVRCHDVTSSFVGGASLLLNLCDPDITDSTVLVFVG